MVDFSTDSKKLWGHAEEVMGKMLQQRHAFNIRDIRDDKWPIQGEEGLRGCWRKGGGGRGGADLSDFRKNSARW